MHDVRLLRGRCTCLKCESILGVELVPPGHYVNANVQNAVQSIDEAYQICQAVHLMYGVRRMKNPGFCIQRCPSCYILNVCVCVCVWRGALSYPVP